MKAKKWLAAAMGLLMMAGVMAGCGSDAGSSGESADGQTLAVHLNDGEPIQNVPRSLKDEGHKVLSVDKNDDGTWELVVEKGGLA